ncbi:MAG: bifunctional sulfate adenylyltransferase/adenylylsulfate kinase [Pyrinomonadaceae bacterium]
MDASPKSHLISPYGDKFVDLIIDEDQRTDLHEYAGRLSSLQLSERALCDLELLATGAFSPMDRFMGKQDFESSVSEMRLGDGTVFPVPVSLPIQNDFDVKLDSEIALRDSRNNILAVMTVEEIYDWDHSEFARSVLRTDDLRHPLNAEMHRWGNFNISGKIRVLSLPKHFDFQNLRLTPGQVRSKLESLGNTNVVAFQTRNPLHRGHEEMCRNAAEAIDGTLLLHPAIGMTKPGDVDFVTRVRTYKALIENYFDNANSLLALIPLAMRMAGPREALWHMLIRRNYGASHFIVGRDHASPGVDSNGNPFYAPAAAQELALQYSDEIGLKPLVYDEMVYVPEEDNYWEISKLKKSATYFSMSGTKMRADFLHAGEKLPAWFARAEVADILMQTYPPLHSDGVCVWFTGLSGAGKSTIAEILTILLNEYGRNVTLLDGDVVRTHLSKGLGFSREDRDTNILRIGFVAAEIVRHRGLAICAAVSPYKAARNEVRNMFDEGRFVEVFVDTPLSVCEERDVKGMYKKARSGEITAFTGIDDPYEAPENADIILDTVNHQPEENARDVLAHLIKRGFVAADLKSDS